MLGKNLAIIENDNCTTGVVWIWQIFGQCVENPVEYAAFFAGFVSFLLWFLPLFPQLLKNFKRGRCDDALSIYFLLFCFFGDCLNLAGAVLSYQLPIQIYLGFYFIFLDCLILGQYFYYKIRRPGGRIRLSNDLGPPILSCLLIVSVVNCVNTGTLNVGIKPNFDDTALNENEFRTRKLLHLPFFKNDGDEIGYIFGSISAICYLCSRFPQLFKNFVRKSTESVSILTFLIIILANLIYGLSVLLAGDDFPYFLHHFPWILGSFGCCFLDCSFIFQYFLYKNRIKFVNLVENDKNDESINGESIVES